MRVFGDAHALRERHQLSASRRKGLYGHISAASFGEPISSLTNEPELLLILGAKRICN